MSKPISAPLPAPIEKLATQLVHLAVAVEQGQSSGVIQRMLAESRAQCKEAAGSATGELRTMLMDFLEALQQWHGVWPSMGERPEFRQAVAREARGWSKRLSTTPQR